MTTKVRKKKRCSKCKDPKFLDEFYRNGQDHLCIPCRKEMNKSWYRRNRTKAKALSEAWRKKNADRNRNAILVRLYGITLEDYHKRRTAQGDRCGICRKKRPPHGNKNKWFDVDHCHRTGRFRGLLCKGCNTGLGRFGDSIEGLQAAIAYLTGK